MLPQRQHQRGAGEGKAALHILTASLALIVLCASGTTGAPPVRQGGFIILGNVSLPDGKRASRVTVKITGMTGLNRETLTDDQGRYEFHGIPAGRYRLVATNPHDPAQNTGEVEADTGRTAGNRVVVHLFMRSAPAKHSGKPGVVSVAEANQQIPKDARKAYEQGLRQKNDNKFEQAMSSFTRAIELYPEYFQALAARGELRIAMNQAAEAIEDFHAALKLNDAYEPALRGAGYCNLTQQKYAEAVEYLDRATAIKPDNAQTWLFLGIASLALDRREPARQSLQRALSLDAERGVTAHIYLADLYAREQRYREAADELQAYLKAKPKAPNAERLKQREAELRERAKSGKQ